MPVAPRPSDGAASSVFTPHQQRILVVLLIPIFMSLLAVSSINVALPALQRGLDASDAELQWAISGYTLVFGMVLVPAGRAGDLFGRRRLFMVGLGVFALGALLSGLAPTGVLLVLARLVMGVGAGLLNPQVTGFIQGEFSGASRARAFGALGAVVGVSVAVGPLLSGGLIAWLGGDLGWRATFLVNVPIALGALVVARHWLPRTVPARARRPDLDPVGVVLLAGALVAVMLPFLDRELGPWRVVLVPVGIGLAALWTRWEARYARRGRAPMVDLRLFQTRSFACGALLIAIYFTGSTSMFVVIAMFMQNGLGYPALHAALIGLPSAVMSSVMSTVAGRVVLRTGRKIVVLGIALALLAVVGSIGVAWANREFGLSPWWLLLTLGILGAGQGLVVSPNQTLSLAEVPPRHSGTAGGVLQTGQRVGTAVGTAVIVGVFLGVASGADWDGAFMAAFALVAACMALALLVALADLRGPRTAAPRG
ncbi:MFS transporter [Micrococcus luteus]|uniref:MFS transporter n=1 Tax=Micrococcus luteus TaxID=1270 RepID=UPI002003E50B|nr:MFS transporter [Micrococcus luteus]MCK6110272.1 MFS transporter [Micrococcus luteus]